MQEKKKLSGRREGEKNPVLVEQGAEGRQSQQPGKPEVVICSDTVFCSTLEVTKVEQLLYIVSTVHLKNFQMGN